MNIIIIILSIFGLAFLLKEASGPWGLISWLRNKLMINKYAGIFFYKLFDCYFCLGCHCGWIIYLINEKNYHWNDFLIWTLAGGSISLIMSAILNHLYKE